MLLSIIIPVYNAGNLLKKSVKNLVSYKENEIEILLINDGSTDNSGSICDKLQKTYNNIKVIHQKNQGVSSARNIGIQKAVGDYVMFVDSDDYLDDGALETIIKRAEKKQADIISYGLKRVFKEGNIENAKLLFDKECYCSCRNEVEREIFPFVLENRIPMYCCVYRRKIIVENNIAFEKELKYSEDYLFLLDNLRYCSSFLYIPELFYNYFIGNNVLSNNYRGILEHVCKEPECNYIHERLKELNILKKTEAEKDKLISIHIALSNIYKQEGIKLVTSEVIKKLKEIKKINITFKEEPRNLRILLYFLMNEYFYCYFGLLYLIQRKDKKRENSKFN